ncbi:MAG TPA: flagellar basal body rod protein FlgC [Symbiobacteriaceae bacterium]
MGLFRAMDTSASALTAQRFRMDVIAHNIANINTTRTAEGGPYRRKVTTQAERRMTFQDILDRAAGRPVPPVGAGVVITSVSEDPSPFRLQYDPGHPDADENGYVQMPNVDLLQELTDLMVATRIYEANVTAFNASKAMAQRALEIGR